jgi:NTE family protein
MASALLRPDVLVLAGGGVVGEAWMNGVLAGVEDGGGADFTRVESYVGTSAGSIVAARLVSGRRPKRPEAEVASAWAEAEAEEPMRGVRGVAGDVAKVGFAMGAPVASAALAVSAPVGAVARGAILRRAGDRGISLDPLKGRIERWRPRFDGRLRICAVDRGNGKRVVFGKPGAPKVSVPEAVAASCAIPFYFRAVRIGDREYVDGGAWSVSNLDAAPVGRDTHVLFLHPTAALTQPWAKAFRLATELELQQLRRRGAQVLHVAPDGPAAAAIGGRFMDPARIDAVLAAGYAQGRRLAAAAATS